MVFKSHTLICCACAWLWTLQYQCDQKQIYASNLQHIFSKSQEPPSVCTLSQTFGMQSNEGERTIRFNFVFLYFTYLKATITSLSQNVRLQPFQMHMELSTYPGQLVGKSVSHSHFQISDFVCEFFPSWASSKGSRQKKTRIFYGQADRKGGGGQPPLAWQ